MLAVSIGEVEQALPFLKTALEANPNIAQFWLSCVDALIRMDCVADAKAVLDKTKKSKVKGDNFNLLKKRLAET